MSGPGESGGRGAPTRQDSLSCGWEVRLHTGEVHRFRRPNQVTLSALQKLAHLPPNARISGLRDGEGFTLTANDQGDFFSPEAAEDFPAGCYDLLVVLSLSRAESLEEQLAGEEAAAPGQGVEAQDCFRARALLKALVGRAPGVARAEALQAVLDSGSLLHLEWFVVTERGSRLDYAIAVFFDAVIVVLDRIRDPGQVLREGHAARRGDGHMAKSLAELAGLIPYGTLLELCRDASLDSGSSSNLDVLGLQASAAGAGDGSGQGEPCDLIRRLVFCGHGLAGSVAHIAALETRQQYSLLNHDCVVSGIAWAAPFFLSGAVHDALRRSGHASQHITFSHTDNAVMDILNTALALVTALSVAEDSTFNPAPFLDSVVALLDSQTATSSALAEAAKAQADILNVISSHMGSHADKHLVPIGAFCLQTPHGTFRRFVREDEQALLFKQPWTIANVRQHFQYPLDVGSSCLEPLLLPPRDLRLIVNLSLAPVISSCNIVCTPERVDIVLCGTHLETILWRGSEPRTIDLDSDDPPQPLYLSHRGFEQTGDEVKLHILRQSPTEVRCLVTGVRYQASFGIVCQTDFGRSEPFVVTDDDVTNAAEVPPIALLYGAVDLEVLRTAFLRGMLAVCSRHPSPVPGEDSGEAERAEGSHSPIPYNPLMETLFELEQILLRSHSLRDISDQYAKRTVEHLLYAVIPASVVLTRIVECFRKPIRIECERRISRLMRKAFGTLGSVFGTVLTVVAAAALAPALVIAMPGVALFHRERRLAGSLLASPGVVAAVPGTIVGGLGIWILARGRRALKNPKNLQYVQLLRVLLHVLDGNPASILEEVTVLEAALCEQFAAVAGGATLERATEAEVHDAMLQFASRPKMAKGSPASTFKRAIPASRKEITMWLQVVGRFKSLRLMLQNRLVVSVIGVHNAGKSTCIERLFGIDTKRGALQRTERPTVYSLPAAVFEGDLVSGVEVDIVDLPGTTDERPHIATMTERFADISTMFLCVFTAGHIAGPERKAIEMLRGKDKDFLVLINKCDTLPELASKEDEFRASYADVLGVPPEIIFFTTLLDPSRVEALRCILFAHLRFLCLETSAGDVALRLLHRTQQADLWDLKQELDVPTQGIGAACAALLGSNQRVSVTAVREYIHTQTQHARQQSRRTSIADLPFDGAALQAELLQPVADMGFTPEVIGLVFECLSQPAPEDPSALPESFTDTRALLQQFQQEADGDDPDGDPAARLQALFGGFLDCTLHMHSLHAFLLSKDVSPQIAARAILDCTSRGVLDEEAALGVASSLSEARDSAVVLPDAALQPLLKGADLLNLLEFNARLSVFKVAPASPEGVYPDFKPDMSVESRLTLFNAKIRTVQRGEGQQSAMLNLDPERLLDHFLEAMSNCQRSALRAGRLTIHLHKNEAIDVAGVFRGVLTTCAEGIRAGKCQFFEVLESGAVVPSLRGNTDRYAATRCFRAVGRIIGYVMANKRKALTFPVPFHLSIFKLILSVPLTMDDLQPDVARSVRQICLMDDATVDALWLSFSVSMGDQVFPLVQGGDDCPVNHLNKFQYLELLVKFYLGQQLPLRQIVLGVQDVCPWELLSVWTPQTLQVLFSGSSDFKSDELKAFTSIHVLAPRSETQQWFWEVIDEMSTDDKGLFLTFVTGSSVVPVGGFKNWPHRMTIVRSLRMAEDSLPEASTCMHILKLGDYTSKDKLRDKLVFAIRNVSAAQYGHA